MQMVYLIRRDPSDFGALTIPRDSPKELIGKALHNKSKNNVIKYVVYMI